MIARVLAAGFRSVLASGALGVLASCGAARVEPPPQAALEASMRLAADSWIATHPAVGNAGWDFGVHYWGLTALQAETGEQRYFDRVHAWGAANQWQPLGGAVTDVADNTLCGMAYWNQQLAGDPDATLALVEPSIQSQRNADYTWIDLFFMGFPLSARYGQSKSDPSYAEGVHRIFAADRALLYSTAEHLWWRDSTFAGSGTYWSRGNGWVLAGLAAAIEYLPAGDANRADLAELAVAMSGRLRGLQKPDGQWSSSLLPADGYDSVHGETSGTALFTFGLARLIHLGLLDRASWLPVANAAWNGMVSTALQSDGVLGYCQPGDNQPVKEPRLLTPADTTNFCVGAFLLAGTELNRLR